MTDSISAVSGTAPNNSASALSEDTKKKLKALGLNPSNYTSESQAQAAIKAAEAKKAETQKPQGAAPSGGTDMQTVHDEAKSLASEMGVYVGTDDTMDDILAGISDKINELKASAGTDAGKLEEVEDFESRYNSISDDYTQVKSAKNMTGASALAAYNKAAFGIAA